MLIRMSGSTAFLQKKETMNKDKQRNMRMKWNRKIRKREQKNKENTITKGNVIKIGRNDTRVEKILQPER